MRSPRTLTLKRVAGRGLLTLPLLALAAGCNLQIGTGIEASEAWNRTYEVSPGATLDVRETNGQIRIEAADGNQIEVQATRIAKASTEEAAKAALKELTISETATAGRVELDSTMPGLQLGIGVSRRVNYNIKVPRATNVTIKTTNGDIRIQSVGGFLRVEATNGQIIAQGLGDGADVSSMNGRVDLDFAAVGSSGIRCKTMNGQVVVTVPKDTSATISARVTNGIVHTENLEVKAEDDSRRRLDGTIGGGGPDIRLETTNGEIRLVGK
jgi:DUF4097 and DUF4098 domain-containing protein YvlB